MSNNSQRLAQSNQYLFAFPQLAELSDHEYAVAICDVLTDDLFITPAEVTANEELTLRANSNFVVNTSGTQVVFTTIHDTNSLGAVFNSTLAALVIVEVATTDIKQVIATANMVQAINPASALNTTFTFTFNTK